MVQRLLKMALGVVLVVAGIAMLLLPGPGVVTIAAGIALFLSQLPRGQRLLARLRVRLRERYGSARVRRVEDRMPKEVFPPHGTAELRELADARLTPPPPPKTRRR